MRIAVRVEKNATPGSVKEKTSKTRTKTAALWGGQPDVPRFHWLGLDPDDARPGHGNLGRRPV